MRATWLPTVLRAAGLMVVEMPGWQGRGREMSHVAGVICHHTATPPSLGPVSTANLLARGRADLPGPLSQLGLDRTGTFWLVADGRCSHNGFGLWGNDSIGIEAFNDGRGEPWPKEQLNAYTRGVAAILQKVGYGTDRVLGHKESDPRRKIDPAGIDMTAFRSQVQRWLTEEDDDMTPEDRKLLEQVARDVADLKKDASDGAGAWDTGKKGGWPVSGRLLLERIAQRLKRVETAVASHNEAVE